MKFSKNNTPTPGEYNGDCFYHIKRRRLDSASAVLEVSATNPEYNQPALRIKQAGTRGGAASIRIDDPNPDIEFVETDQVAPAGKYEIAVQSDKLQINGRNASDKGFETIVVFQRRAAGGNIGFGTASQFGAGQGVIAIANARSFRRRIPLGVGYCMSRTGRSNIEDRKER